MKKKYFILSVLLVLISVSAFAADYDNADWSSMYKPGNFIIEGGIGIEGYTNGFYSYYMSQVPIYAGAEIILFKPRMGDFAFLDFGLAVKTRIAIPIYSTYSHFDFSLAPLFTVHMGFRGLADSNASKFLDKFDVFIQTGVGFDFTRISRPYYLNHWASYVFIIGFNYFIGDNFRIGLASTTWGYHSGVTFSIGFKFGPKPSVR